MVKCEILDNLDQPFRAKQIYDISDNPLGERLRPFFQIVLCDLADARSMNTLSERTSVSIKNLKSLLYIKDRYEANDPDVAMNLRVSVLADTEPHNHGQTPDNWRKTLPSIPPQAYANFGRHEKDMAEMILSNKSSQIIVIMGGVGCGKTTYIDYCFNFLFPDFEPLKNYAFIHADFRDDKIKAKYNNSTDGRGLDSVLDYCLNRYFNDVLSVRLNKTPTLHEIFQSRISEDDWQPYIELFDEDERPKATQDLIKDWRKNLTYYNESRINYIKSTLKGNAVICIDNIDHCDPRTQERIIKDAIEKQSWYDSILVIAIRESSLGNLCSNMNMAAYWSFTKHLTTPNIFAIYDCRLEILKSLITSEYKEPFETNIPFPNAFRFASKEQLIEYLSDAIHTLKQDDANLFVSDIANHNLRRIFSFLEELTCSGYFNVLKFIPNLIGQAIEPAELPNPWPVVKGYPAAKLHAVMKVAVLGRDSSYNPKSGSNFVINLFNNGHKMSIHDHFIRYRILDYLNKNKQLPKDKIVSDFESIGFNNTEIVEAIGILDSASLIESTDNSDGVKKIYFITRAGQYYINIMCNKLVYLRYVKDAINQPPIMFEGPDHNLDQAILNTAKVLSFMNSIEQHEIDQIMAHGETDKFLDITGNMRIIEHIASELFTEVQGIATHHPSMRSQSCEILRAIQMSGAPLS